MESTFNIILEDMKDEIDNLVNLYDNPKTETYIWTPTTSSMKANYITRGLQIEFLERTIIPVNERSLFAKGYAGVIVNRFEDLSKYFSHERPVFSDEHRKKLGKLQRSVNFFYNYCTNIYF